MLDRTHSAGAGIHCELFNFYLPTGPCISAFDGEIEDIVLFVQQLLICARLSEKVVILSNSKSVLQTLLNKQINSQTILECRSFLKALEHRILIQWIPAHCGIVGNEKADDLAKKRALIEQSMILLCSFNMIKLIVNLTLRKILGQNMIQSAGDRKWKILREDKSIISSYPRKRAVALFRGLTGHDCLQDDVMNGD